MKKSSFAIATVFLIMCATSASAQIARVFLAGSGNDVNDCSDITTPCRSLQGAVNQCPVNGEVIIIASGGFGTATINKSLTVDAAPGVLAFNARTINVNIAPTDTVTLRGLTLNGAVFGDPAGVLFVSGGNLNIENCDIGGFSAFGVYQLASGSNLRITRSGIHDTTDGIYKAGYSGGSSSLVVAHCFIHDVSSVGLWVYARGSASVTDSVFANNYTAMAAYSGVSGERGTISVDRCLISGNAAYGFFASGTNNGTATIYVSNSSIKGNLITLLAVTGGASGGTASVISFGNNSVANNTTTTPFTSTLPTT